MKQNYYVTKHGSAWAVKGEGNKRSSSVHPTQGAAIQAGKPLAKQAGGELRIQGQNGQFREAYSYGSDPFPPKG